MSKSIYTNILKNMSRPHIKSDPSGGEPHPRIIPWGDHIIGLDPGWRGGHIERLPSMFSYVCNSEFQTKSKTASGSRYINWMALHGKHRGDEHFVTHSL
jgi:hypothetical protein